MVTAGLVLALQTATVPDRLNEIIERVSEEAEVFQQLAPRVIGQETLEHRGRKAPPRFRPRLGRAALEAPRISYLRREIISEYGYGSFREAAGALREFRQVVSVDGHPVTTPEKARLTLAENMRSDDDRLRKRMLQEFEKHGTIGAVSDFGQILLLFRRRMRAHYDFAFLSEGWIGADQAIVLSYRQKDGPDSLRIYQGRELIRRRLEGEIWVRQPDYLPLRITMRAEVDEGGRTAVHAATVDYFRSANGLMLPASVAYTKHIDETLMVENLYRYSNFRMFQVEAEIKFLAEEPKQP